MAAGSVHRELDPVTGVLWTQKVPVFPQSWLCSCLEIHLQMFKIGFVVRFASYSFLPLVNDGPRNSIRESQVPEIEFLYLNF